MSINSSKDFSSRLIKLRSFFQLKNLELADILGVSEATVSRWVQNKTQPRNIKLTFLAFAEKHNMNLDWLENGEGDMLLAPIKINHPDNQESQIESFETKNNRFKSTKNLKVITVPIVPMKAYAQYVDEFYDEAAEITFDFVNLEVSHYGKGHYLAFKISGDSMNGGLIDDTPDGATVLAREIGQHLWSGALYKSQFGHVIITNKNILMKDILEHDRENHVITCHSRNPSPEYNDFDLPLGYSETEETYVMQIFKVISRHGM